MAGEIHHLLAENARRVEERVRAGHDANELDSLVGLVSQDLRMSATPHEGLSRIAARSLLRAHEERANLSKTSSPEVSGSKPQLPERQPSELTISLGNDARLSDLRNSKGERISASMLLAIPPARPPIEDRASPLRAEVMRRPRAGVVPALYVLTLTLFTAVSLVLTRWIECGH